MNTKTWVVPGKSGWPVTSASRLTCLDMVLRESLSVVHEGMCVRIRVCAYAGVHLRVCKQALMQMCMVSPPGSTLGHAGHVWGRWGAVPLRLPKEKDLATTSCTWTGHPWGRAAWWQMEALKAHCPEQFIHLSSHFPPLSTSQTLCGSYRYTGLCILGAEAKQPCVCAGGGGRTGKKFSFVR